MRVLYCCHADNYHIEKWVPAMEKAGLEVHILTLRPSKKLKTPQTIIKPIFSKITWFDFFLLAPKIRETYFLEQCDVLFCSFGSTYGLAGYMSSIKPLFIQTWSRDIGADSSVNKKDALISKWISQKICSSAQGITTDGPHFKDYVLKKWPQILPDKICSTWWGIDSLYWQSSANRKSDIRSKMGIPKSSTVFISPRGVFWYYRPLEILTAIKELANLYDEVYFLIPTLNHDCIPEVQDLLNELKNYSRIKIYDSFLDTDNFIELLISSDILLSLPLFDGISEVIQEGMSCGVLPILNPIPANLFLKEFGMQAFWTESNQPSSKEIFNSLQKLIELKRDSSNESQFQLMKSANSDFIEKHCSVDNTARKLSYFFETNIESNSTL